ncbi:hypothetical protein [Mycoplasmopsis cynos]|uniref:hypothetical protein n=1 Tax=Mycoplasmopsis cynos TaxID=171284 RepID=UPI0024C8C624|nr:hypothetical protein [Mycoplasmopsis cynos]WAM07706.1 hypothetical protein ONA21_06345 [Mycoplasmopsis cynos]
MYVIFVFKFFTLFLNASYLLLIFSKVTPLSYNSKAFFHFSSFEASDEPLWFSSFLSILGLSVLAVSPFSVFLSFVSDVLSGLFWELSLPSFSFSWFLFFASSLSFGVLVAGGVIFFSLLSLEVSGVDGCFVSLFFSLEPCVLGSGISNTWENSFEFAPSLTIYLIVNFLELKSYS